MQYQSKPRRDRDFMFLPYNTLECLVFYDKILYNCVRRFPSNESVKEGYLLKDVFPLLARLV